MSSGGSVLVSPHKNPWGGPGLFLILGEYWLFSRVLPCHTEKISYLYSASTRPSSVESTRICPDGEQSSLRGLLLSKPTLVYFPTANVLWSVTGIRLMQGCGKNVISVLHRRLALQKPRVTST